MIDYLFIQPPFWGVTCPPLGLALLKASAIRAGHTARCLDLNIALWQFAGRKYRHFWQLSEGYNHCEDPDKVLQFYREFYHFIIYWRKKIEELDPAQVWITVQNSSSLFAHLLIKELKGMNRNVYIGGPQVWSAIQEGLNPKTVYGADEYYGGEGEIIFGAKNKNNTITTHGLDILPWADHDDFHLLNYGHPYSLPMWNSRGCINKCVYCTERGMLGGRYRSRSGEEVYTDMVYQWKKYKAYFFHFVDSVSNGNISELEEFCNLMSGPKGLHTHHRIKWSMGNCTIRKEMRLPLYKKMKQAGCTFIGYGLETPVPRLLKAIGKHSAVGVDIAGVVRDAHKAGLKVSLNFMFGLPGETTEDFEEMLNFIRVNREYIYQVNPAVNLCAVYPGSLLYSDPTKYGIKLGDHPMNWSNAEWGKDTNLFIQRRCKFTQFIEETEKLGFKNFFGKVKAPPALPPKRRLYYSGSVGIILDEKLRLPWYMARLWASFRGLLVRAIKHPFRKLYYKRLK